MVHFRLSDEGRVELEGFGEEFDNYVGERVHSILGEPDVSHLNANNGCPGFSFGRILLAQEQRCAETEPIG
jgi:hypothetical protein